MSLICDRGTNIPDNTCLGPGKRCISTEYMCDGAYSTYVYASTACLVRADVCYNDGVEKWCHHTPSLKLVNLN